MAGFKVGLVVIVLVVGLLCGGSLAQSGCTTALIKLSPCLNFITGNSSTPSPSCCTQLASVVQSQPRCLCTALGGGSILGITINQTRALELPGRCNVKTPPVSQCNSAADGPAMSPAGTPDSSPSASPSDSTRGDTPVPADQNPIIPSDPSSGSGQALGPSSSASQDNNSLNLTIQTLILILSVVSFASISPLI